jgi:(p)ppGpp synthase/HD superfamily hydrolase
MNDDKGLILTSRFTNAVEYVRQLHTGFRKGSVVPYMAHLLGVASLAMGESGEVPFLVTEDVVIAALLHDAVEDEGAYRDFEISK